MTNEGIVKVTDFGIAKATTSSTINNTSNVIGSVHYFSPEQARGGYVDEKSDIYSLGVVMYEMITGVVPFDADNHISVAMKQIQEKPIPPSKRNSEIKISQDLEDIIMKCLEKHQSFRFRSAEEFLNKLNSIDGYIRDISTDKKEIIDSPTIIMPKVNSDDENIIELNLVDEDSDKAFKTFFGGDSTDDKSEKSDPKKTTKTKNDKIDAKEKKKNMRITVLAIISALIVAIVGGVIGFKAMLYVPEVTVPDLVGKKQEEAQKIVEDLGLKFSVSDSEYDDEYDEGEIIEQSVEQDTKVKEGYPLSVVLSKGQREIEIPNLVGKYAIEAGIILSEAGLTEGHVTEEFSSSVPSGEIIEQYPDEGTAAKENDKVDYVVSKGVEIVYITMPNLIGKQLETAKTAIVNSGLIVGQMTEESSEDTEAGLIMKQSIPAGQEVAEGTSIWMTVSSGPDNSEIEETDDIDDLIDDTTDDTTDDTIDDTTDSNSYGTYPLTIKLPTDKDTVLVVVQRVIGEGREIIYSKEVETSEQNITINVEGKGKQVFEFYIDNELYDTTEITFE
jgi:serine/threonine-protein kinase